MMSDPLFGDLQVRNHHLWGFRGHNVQPHCWDSLTGTGIETKTVPSRKQEGRREVCMAGARMGWTVWAVQILLTVVGVLGEVHTCW